MKTINLSAIQGPATFEVRPFLQLFADAIYFARAADSKKSAAHSARNARASVAFTVFSVEAALNSLLAQARISPEIQQRITFMQFLDKTDAIATFFGRGARFDRKATQVTVFSEILRIRNGLAHPKNQKRPVRGFAKGDDHMELHDDHQPPSNFLKIPLAMENWDGSHAFAAINAADLFLSYFFVDVLNAAEDLRTHVFISTVYGSGASPFRMTLHQTEAAEQVVFAKRKMSLRCSYFPPDTVLGTSKEKPRVRT